MIPNAGVRAQAGSVACWILRWNNIMASKTHRCRLSQEGQKHADSLRSAGAINHGKAVCEWPLGDADNLPGLKALWLQSKQAIRPGSLDQGFNQTHRSGCRPGSSLDQAQYAH